MNPKYEENDEFDISKNKLEINIVHDYLTPMRPSLQTNYQENNMASRKFNSINYNTKTINKNSQSILKKEVNFEKTEKIESENAFKHDFHDNEAKSNEKKIPTKFEENVEENEEENKLQENVIKIKEEKHLKKKKEKNKTVIIQTNEAIVEEENPNFLINDRSGNLNIQNTENQVILTENKRKSRTISTNKKNSGKNRDKRNSKLVAFSKIVDPLEKIDNEHQSEYNSQIDQKLIFGEDGENNNDQKYMTFYKSPVNEFKIKLEQQDHDIGKYSCISVFYLF